MSSNPFFGSHASSGGSFNPLYGILGGAAGGFMGNLFGGNPADAASPYLDQISGVLKQYLGPYAQAGQAMLPGLQNIYGQLMNNPGQYMNQMGQNYQQSPGFRFQMNQAMQAANNAAAAGGFAGSPQHQYNAQNMANQLANQDYYNWLGHAEKILGQGLQGGQSIYNTGAQAGSSLAENLAQGLSAQAQNAYAGANNQNQMMGGLFSTLGSLAGFL